MDMKNILDIDLKIVISVFVVGVFLLSPHVYAQSAFEDPGARNPQGKAGGGLSAVNNNLDSGNVTLGSASQVVLLFRNDGNKPVTMGAIDIYPSSNVSASIAQNQCAKDPLESGAVCAVALSVKGLQRGRFRVELLIRHDGRSKLITSTVAGTVDASDDDRFELVNDIEAVPSALEFGSLSDSRTQIKSIVLRNVTSKKINIFNLSVQANPESGFTLNADCASLNSGEACLATITWSPEQTGPASGVLVVDHDGPAAVTSIPLNGSYEPDSASQADVFPSAVPGKGLLTSSQTEVDFGTGIQTSSAITVSLVNVGDTPIMLQDIRLSNEKNGVEISRKGCAAGTLLDPVEACPMTLTWEPVREGDILDDIQIRHDGARGILVLPLRGSATKAVNKDSETIFLGGVEDTSYFSDVPRLSAQELGLGNESTEGNVLSDVTSSDQTATSGTSSATTKKSNPIIDVRGVLDGYRITSLASNRAIVAGPGGSRVVFDGEEAVIGGVLWDVRVRSSAVQFSVDKQKVLILFDKSLSSVNTNGSQSDGNSSGNSTSSSGNSLSSNNR